MRYEYRQPDEKGRIPLSSREYAAIRAIWGAVNALTEYHGELESRCRLIPYGWRDLRCLVKLSEKVMRETLLTVPSQKLLQMKKELDNTICIVKTRGVCENTEDGFMYVSEETIINLCKSATEINCFGCEKKHNEAKRNCYLYKNIQAVFNYEFEQCDYCPFSEGVAG